MQVLQLFPELIALSSNAIHIKCYDFKRPINSGYEFCFMMYKTSFVMAMVLLYYRCYFEHVVQR